MMTRTEWDYIPAADVKQGDLLDVTQYHAKTPQVLSVLWVDSIETVPDMFGAHSVTFNGTVTFGRSRRVYALKAVERA